MASWILDFCKKMRMTEMGGEKVSPKLFSSNRIHKGHGIMDFRILQENENDRNG